MQESSQEWVPLVRDSSESMCWKTKGSSEKSKFILEECLIQTSYSLRTISTSHCYRSFLRIPSLACSTPCSAGGFLRVAGKVLLLPKLEEGCVGCHLVCALVGTVSEWEDLEIRMTKGWSQGMVCHSLAVSGCVARTNDKFLSENPPRVAPEQRALLFTLLCTGT